MPFRGVFPADKFVPAPYGLFSAADVTNHGGNDEHWGLGFDFESELCRVEGQLLHACGGDPTTFREASEGSGRHVEPFFIRAQDACLTPGYNVADWKGRIFRQLEAITQRGVEHELWTGAFALTQDVDDETERNQFLASDAAVKVNGGSAGSTGAAVKPKLGLALLEQALAECGDGGQGTIHVTSAVGTMLGDEGGQGDGNELVTFNGNKIVIGSGYDGRGPGATSAPANWFTPWIYATGPVAVDLGAKELVTPELRNAVNPRTNEITYVAVRPASVYWDGCCHFAVQVDVRL